MLTQAVSDSKARQELRTKAAAGDVEAQVQLGISIVTQQGEVPPQLLNEGAGWLKKAAEQDHVGAQFMLGLCYLNGMGVEQDIAEGGRLLKAAAPSGNADVKMALATYYLECESNKAEGCKWLRVVSEDKDNPEAAKAARAMLAEFDSEKP